MTDENKLITERKKKLNDSKEYQSVYPNNFDKIHSATEIIEGFDSKSKEELELNKKEVSIAGRLLTIRLMGNSAFANLHDDSGKIQIFIDGDINDKSFIKNILKTTEKKIKRKIILLNKIDPFEEKIKIF